MRAFAVFYKFVDTLIRVSCWGMSQAQGGEKKTIEINKEDFLKEADPELLLKWMPDATAICRKNTGERTNTGKQASVKESADWPSLTGNSPDNW